LVLFSIQFASFLRSAKPEFVTKTYYTTVTFYYTPPPGQAQDVEPKTKIISNVVTQEAEAIYGQPQSSAQVTLSSDYMDPPLEVKTQVTKFTYYNTLYYGDKPLVLSTEEVVSNLATIPKDHSGPSKASIASSPLETKTYFSTYVFYKTVVEDEVEKVLSTEEVITQVVVTQVLDDVEVEASLPEEKSPEDFLDPTFLESSIAYTEGPEITKTYFTTFTYMTTALVGDKTVINSDVVIKSEIVKEPFDVSSPVVNFDAASQTPGALAQEKEQNSDEVLATRTYYVSYTYLSTILDGSLTTVSSNVEVSSSIVVEPLDAAENPSLWSELVLATAVQPVASSTIGSTGTPTVTYYRLGPNIFAQLRTVFATYGTVVTGIDGFLSTVNTVKSNTVTSTITASSVPAGVIVINSAPPAEASAIFKDSPTTVDAAKPSVITGSTVIFFNSAGEPQGLDLAPSPTFGHVSKTVTPMPIFEKFSSTKVTVTATEATVVPGSDGGSTEYPAGQVLVLVDRGNGSTVGFPITGIDMQKPALGEQDKQKVDLTQPGVVKKSQSVIQSFSSSSSPASSPNDLTSFTNQLASINNIARPSSGTSQARPAGGGGGSLISTIGTGLVNLGALAGALAAGNAGAQAVSGLDFSPIFDSVSSLFRSGVNPFGRRNDSNSRDNLKPDRLRFPDEPEDHMMPPKPPTVRNQQQPHFIPVGQRQPTPSAFFEDDPELPQNNLGPGNRHFIPLRNSLPAQSQRRPLAPPLRHHQQQRPQFQQQGQPARPFQVFQQPSDLPPRSFNQEIIERHEPERNDFAVNSPGPNVQVLRGSGVPISPGQVCSCPIGIFMMNLIIAISLVLLAKQ
jgi:hypothetical protein